jgi:hypothetical protein
VTDPWAPLDIGEYCRRVEDYLTRVNGGHLVRIVGPGFQLVRAWAEAGIPLTVVFRGIELKADRHQAGASRRPLRIEFCASDVREVYAGWRRAVGLHTVTDPTTVDSPAADTNAGVETKRPSLARHLERAAERLVRASGRLDLPDAFRGDIAGVLEQVAAMRERARKARGEARTDIEQQLAPLDAALLAAARKHTDAATLAELARMAADDLAPFRSRLPGPAWERSVSLTVDRLLRERYGLPTIDPHGP